MSYIIERPAGTPDWVQLGIKILGKSEYCDKWMEDVLVGYSFVPGDKIPYSGRKGDYSDAKPWTPWTPNEGEWCAFWQEGDKNFSLRTFDRIFAKRITSQIPGQRASSPWDYCARITNDDGSLIDILCTVGELKAKTDWLGSEEKCH